MDPQAIQSVLHHVLGWVRRLAIPALCLGVGALFCYGVLRWTGAVSPGNARADAPATTPAEGSETTVVRMPKARWAAADIRIEPATYAPYAARVWRTGRLALNETRIAHIAPMVEGVVREVKVRLGQVVETGDVLAVIDAREVGQAKLDLVKARLAASNAKAQHAWTQATSAAAAEMVKAMANQASIVEIEQQFKDRAIGDLRQQLITAYSRRLQVKAQYDSATDAQGVLPKATLVRLRADYEAAEAAYGALCEEVNFQARQQVRMSEQKVREAQTAEALSEVSLMMLGYTWEEVEAMDPIREGPQVALYAIRAPFSGTVIEQHAVLAERVGPGHQMFKLADLTTLWLKAEIPQNDLALVQDLTRRKVKFRATEGAEGTAEGEVFYTGDVVNDETRTVALMASVANTDRKLKPGVFVEVELTNPGAAVVQVAAGAIQRVGSQPFVFVHGGGDAFHRVDVKLGQSSDGVVEVAEGLKPGQPVVVSGGFVLKSELLKDQIAGD